MEYFNFQIKLYLFVNAIAPACSMLYALYVRWRPKLCGINAEL